MNDVHLQSAFREHGDQAGPQVRIRPDGQKIQPLEFENGDGRVVLNSVVVPKNQVRGNAVFLQLPVNGEILMNHDDDVLIIPGKAVVFGRVVLVAGKRSKQILAVRYLLASY